MTRIMLGMTKICRGLLSSLGFTGTVVYSEMGYITVSTRNIQEVARGIEEKAVP